jgi:hypothetical protein
VNAFGRRLRVLRRSIRSPGDAWLACRMAVWRLTLPLLKWVVPLPRLARLMWSASAQRKRDPAREEQIATLAEAISGRRGGRRLDNCLERSLVAYRFLSQAGAEPRLVVGVSRDEPVRGHVWVMLDGQPLRDSVDEFEEVTAFGTEGALIPSAARDGAPATKLPRLGRLP